jgi:hypothetical protein
MGQGEIDADADVLERREGRVEVEVRMGTGKRGREENAHAEIPEEEKHRPRMHAKQERPHFRIEAGPIVQTDEEGQAAVDRE